MSVEFEIIEDNTDEWERELELIFPRVLESLGLAGEAFAKVEITKSVYDTPESRSGYKRTGNLRNSITHTTDEDYAYIGTNVVYAPYVEMGTSRMRERPFIRPAITEHLSEYEQIIENTLSDA